MKLLTITSLLLPIIGGAIAEEHESFVTLEDRENPLGALNWHNPYERPRPSVACSAQNLAARHVARATVENRGPNAVTISMCRDAAGSDCDDVWVSTSNYCYTNEQWFGWKGPGIPISVKLSGETCCAFYATNTCNKSGSYFGWINKVCPTDTGVVQISGTLAGYMCNIPYGSAGIAMDSQPADISAIPSTAAAALSTGV